jgi:hypothetical protein
LKSAVILVLAWLSAIPVWAQFVVPARSVWVDDFTPETLADAIASGKTTLVYSGGSSMAEANHVQVARYVAGRVAEELANALVLPIAPDDAAASRGLPDGGMPGNAYEIVSRGIRMGGFEDVVIIADEGAGPDDRTLENLAQRLEADQRPLGVRVLYANAHEIRPGQDMTLNADYLRRWANRTVSAARRKRVEDQAELLFVDPEREWLRPDMIAVEDVEVVVPALGRILLEQRVSSILNQIRALSPAHLR